MLLQKPEADAQEAAPSSFASSPSSSSSSSSRQPSSSRKEYAPSPASLTSSSENCSIAAEILHNLDKGLVLSRRYDVVQRKVDLICVPLLHAEVDDVLLADVVLVEELFKELLDHLRVALVQVVVA
eukprot:CAMPEP_0180311492 /NCGR_PEP_ID=MMETSP0988-20121125/30286_1 /TAXON_ID=697907 /ORGANISM="non described non described, Strain CCMP2293" /LENGTH=125 /DNA_ID=CAMNT_0022295591 /DNA_START=92 /DNA_END=468 /DNA_ORIENTATION=-